jgi:hypothetical protein
MDLKDFDPKQTLDEIKASLLSYAGKKSPEVIQAVESYVQGAETRISDLVDYMADGGEVKFLLDRLAQEKDILLSEVLSFVVLAKGVASDAINNVQDIILQALKKVLEDVEKKMDDK